MDLSTIDHDVTIDTCVLVHACNREVAKHASCLDLLLTLREDTRLRWVLDDNGKAAPAIETSLLYAEYHESLSPQSVPLVLLASFLAFERVTFAPRPNRVVREKIQRLIPKNHRDRVVLGAAAMSRGHVLVTNDFKDFSPRVRNEAKSDLDVRIVDSDEL